MTKAVKGPFNKIKQSHCSFLPGIVQNDLALCPAFIFEIKMVDNDLHHWVKISCMGYTLHVVFARRCFCCWPSIRQEKAVESFSDIN